MRRLNPFSGMNVSLFDLTFSAIEAANAVKHRINSDLYNKGVVNGLTVFASGTEDGAIAVTSGVAYDPDGERISVPVLQDRLRYSGSLLRDSVATYRVVARYVQGNDGTLGVDVDGNSQFRHLMDSFSIAVLKSGADSIQTNDVSLASIVTTVVGGSMIFDSTIKDTFSAKFAVSGTDLSAADLTIVGEFITTNGASMNRLFIGAGGLSVASGATFYRQLVGMSDIRAYGDIETLTPGKGLVLTSPDGTKRARIMLDNTGVLTQDSLNYTL